MSESLDKHTSKLTNSAPVLWPALNPLNTALPIAFSPDKSNKCVLTTGIWHPESLSALHSTPANSLSHTVTDRYGFAVEHQWMWQTQPQVRPQMPIFSTSSTLGSLWGASHCVPTSFLGGTSIVVQRLTFHHLKRPGYNTEFLLYPRPFRWWKYFCCLICVTLLWALHFVIKQQFFLHLYLQFSTKFFYCTRIVLAKCCRPLLRQGCKFVWLAVRIVCQYHS